MDIKKQLMRDEGNVPHAYQDSLGYWTIGVGFLIDERKGGRLPDAVVEFWLDYEVKRITGQLQQSLSFFSELNEARQGVLINMAFNLGVSGLLGFKKTLALISDKNYSAAASEMLNSKWANQVGKRADRLARQMKTGSWI